jgi:adenylate kinase
MLRTFASHTGPGGQHVRERLERGDYFSDEEMIPLVEQRLTQADTDHGFILEGFPRTLAQAQAMKAKIDVAFYLFLSPEEGERRLLARHRTDDTLDIIRHRQEQYQQEADKVISFYREKDLLEEVDANRPVEEILADLFSRLNLNR